jgi:hypothetical protein
LLGYTLAIKKERGDKEEEWNIKGYLRGQRELFERTEGVIWGDGGSYLRGRRELFERT